jgi:hypothetical protein
VAFNDLLLNASPEENDALVNIIHPGQRRIELELMLIEGSNAAEVFNDRRDPDQSPADPAQGAGNDHREHR